MTTSAYSTRRHDALIFIVLWLGATLLVWLTPSHFLTSDAINNLEYIAADNRFELWHGQHLLALWPGYVTAQLTQLSPYMAMRLAHAVLAGATVALVYAALRALVGNRWIALPVAAALVFSFGFWHYASDPDIYMPGYAATALLLWALVAALRAPGTRRMLALGLAAALAMLMHQVQVEIAGLVGLALVWLAVRRSSIPVQWAHVAVYGVAALLPVLLLYLVGWREASAWLVAQGQPAPDFPEWALRYFGTAQSGEASWGDTLALRTLPVAAYAVVQSWILPPLARDVGGLFIPGLLAAGVLGVGAHFPLLIRRLLPVERVVAWLCVLGLLANGISGWWWQAGNVKFYLFMQLYVLVLVAIYARAALAQVPVRRVAAASLVALGVGLVLSHVNLGLPYATRGGVFQLLKHFGDQPDVKLYIQDRVQDRAIKQVSDRSARSLPEADCDEPPIYGHATNRHIWVLSAARASTCKLDGAKLVDWYYADRSRTVWEVWDVTELTTMPR